MPLGIVFEEIKFETRKVCNGQIPAREVFGPAVASRIVDCREHAGLLIDKEKTLIIWAKEAFTVSIQEIVCTVFVHINDISFTVAIIEVRIPDFYFSGAVFQCLDIDWGSTSSRRSEKSSA